jgi:hypothetical protein
MRLAGIQLSPESSFACGFSRDGVCRAGIDWLFARSPQDAVGRVVTAGGLIHGTDGLAWDCAVCVSVRSPQSAMLDRAGPAGGPLAVKGVVITAA